MSKTELCAKIAEKTGLTKADSKKALEAFQEAVVEAVKADDKVQLTGFGTFAKKEHAAREGRNPATGETMQIAASTSLGFKASKHIEL